MPKLLITGVCGFVGSALARQFLESNEDWEIVGVDNLSRKGSEFNLEGLRAQGVQFFHGDVRCREDVDELPVADWMIDCAANPSVLAGLNGGAAQVVQHNLGGTLNLLEKCRRDHCGFVMLSTSRVYSIEALSKLSMQATDLRFEPLIGGEHPTGFSVDGISETFSTQAPVSLYGATKLASEVMALEYGATYGFPVWINRCGVLAGAGQFGKIDQGIFSYWVYQWLLGRPLAYIGFGGTGLQVRDFLCPADLLELILLQLGDPDRKVPRIVNVGGGRERSLSLKQLSLYCEARFGRKVVESKPETRPFDIPYYVTDGALAGRAWNWKPRTSGPALLDEIADWALANRNLVERGF